MRTNPSNGTIELKGLLGGLGSDDGAPEAISGLVKGLGIRALTSCGVLEAMSDKLANDKTKEGKGAEAGCNLFGALVGTLGVHFEPFGVPMLGQVIACYDHKAPTVREAAITAATSLVSSVNPNAVRLVLPALFGGMKAKGFREKCGALTLLADRTASINRYGYKGYQQGCFQRNGKKTVPGCLGNGKDRKSVV